MNPIHTENQTSDIKSRVRSHAVSVAIAALLMLYFGFINLEEPTGTDLFHRASWVFYHTLRIGGIAMAVLALWFWMGHPTALWVDAIVSVVIGMIFILTGLCMWMDGGGMLQPLFNMIFSWMFISSGVQNWKTFVQIKSSIDPNDPYRENIHHSDTPQKVKPESPILTDQSVPGWFNEPEKNGPFQTSTEGQPVESSTPLETKREENVNATEPSSVKAPPDGFLASFADQKEPPRE